MFYVRTILDKEAQAVDADSFTSTGPFVAFTKDNAWIKSFVLNNVVELWESDDKTAVGDTKKTRSRTSYRDR